MCGREDGFGEKRFFWKRWFWMVLNGIGWISMGFDVFFLMVFDPFGIFSEEFLFWLKYGIVIYKERVVSR